MYFRSTFGQTMRLSAVILALLLTRCLGADALAQASQSTPTQARPAVNGQLLIVDFEADSDGGLPTRW
jgi:hypothetical protein